MSDENKQLESVAGRPRGPNIGADSGFNDAETEALKKIAPDATEISEMSLWWRRFKGAFAIGGAFGRVAKFFLLFSAFILAFQAGVLEFLQRGGGK